MALYLPFTNRTDIIDANGKAYEICKKWKIPNTITRKLTFHQQFYTFVEATQQYKKQKEQINTENTVSIEETGQNDDISLFQPTIPSETIAQLLEPIAYENRLTMFEIEKQDINRLCNYLPNDYRNELQDVRSFTLSLIYRVFQK